MLFIVVLLVVFLANTHAQDSTPQINTSTTTILMPELNSTFVKFNKNWSTKLIWDESITREALQEAIERNSTQADFKIRRKKAIIKCRLDKRTMAEKVEGALVYPFMRAEKFLHLLPRYTYYGCNGIYNRKSGQDVLTVACLYRKKKEGLAEAPANGCAATEVAKLTESRSSRSA